MKHNFYLKAFAVRLPILITSVALALGATVRADEIVGVTATASTWWHSQHGHPDNLVNNSGMLGSQGFGDAHNFALSGAVEFWHSAGGPGVEGTSVINEQWVVFNLGGVYNLSRIYIWQMNQAFSQDTMLRGVNGFNLEYSTDGGVSYVQGPTGLNLAVAQFPNPQPVFAEWWDFPFNNVTHVRLNIESAHSGLTVGNVGLSEVKFDGTAIPEPSSLFLFSGLGMFALGRRKR